MFHSSSHGESLHYSARQMYVTTQLYLTRTEVCLLGTRTQQESSQSKIHRFFPAVAEIKFVFQLQNPHSPCLHPHPLSLPPPPPRCGGGGEWGLFHQHTMLVCYSGAQKLGVAVALINFNLRSKPLSHSIMAAGPSALFVGAGQSISFLLLLCWCEGSM